MVQTYRHVVEAVLEKIAFCTILGSDLVDEATCLTVPFVLFVHEARRVRSVSPNARRTQLDQPEIGWILNRP